RARRVALGRSPRAGGGPEASRGGVRSRRASARFAAVEDAPRPRPAERARLGDRRGLVRGRRGGARRGGGLLPGLRRPAADPLVGLARERVAARRLLVAPALPRARDPRLRRRLRPRRRSGARGARSAARRRGGGPARMSAPIRTGARGQAEPLL